MDLQDLQRIKNKFDIVGNDEGLVRAIETAVAVAPTDLTVLITGESGVGKETIPRLIHQFSRRKTGKYLAVNCGALPEGTINAELFGHEKGAFTGAVGERKGYFEEADGGTLFLDEIGELPKDTQALLLRVLQNGEYIKVGSSKVEKTDVRIVAATNANLSYAVATGKFREDLYYRLSGIQITMPALRDRNKDDIYLLFRKFSSDFSEKYNLCKIALSHEAIGVLTSYRWPGNIRQLKNISETVTALESKPVTPGSERITIGPEVLGKYIPKDEGALMAPLKGGADGNFSEDEKQKLGRAIIYLKQEVDALRDEVEALKAGAPSGQKLPRLIEDTPFTRQETAGAAREDDRFDDLPGTRETPQRPARTENFDFHEAESAPLQQSEGRSIREMSDERIDSCLKKYNGKIKAAAAELGISERTIYRRLAEKKKQQQ